MKLLSSPPFYDELTIKAGLNGITVLKQYRYKKRYLGSKVWEVLPNGNLIRKSELLKNKTPGSDQTTRGKKCQTMSKNITQDTEETTNKKNSFTINKTEVRRRLLTFVSSMPANARELYFWTVTFPQGISDETAYRLFNVWLTKLRQRNLLKNYLWVAERQKNKTIHFHIAVPHKMNVKIANREMMVCLCGAARKKEVNKTVFECKRYNGVDIDKEKYFDKSSGKWVRTKRALNFAGRGKRKILAYYLTKYITKNNTQFVHLAWHNSRGFSAIFTAITFTVAEFVRKYQLKKFVQLHSVCENEFFQFHPWLDDPPPEIVGELEKLNSFLFDKN